MAEFILGPTTSPAGHKADVQTVGAGERGLLGQLLRIQRKVRSRKWKKGLEKVSRSGMLRLIDSGADSDSRNTNSPSALEAG